MSLEKKVQEANWWALTIRGVIAVLFGIAAIFWPGITLLTLIYLFSAFILVDGLVRIVASLVGVGHSRHWFLGLILGLIELGVGVYLIRHPGVSFATLILLIAFTLIIVGVAHHNIMVYFGLHDPKIKNPAPINRIKYCAHF